MVFSKYIDFGSVRQALIWFRQHDVCLPALPHPGATTVLWKLPVYSTIWGILTNPFYAGAYAYGGEQYERRSWMAVRVRAKGMPSYARSSLGVECLDSRPPSRLC